MEEHQDSQRAGTLALWWEAEGTGEEKVLGGPNNHHVAPTGGLLRGLTEALYNNAWWDEKRQRA